MKPAFTPLALCAVGLLALAACPAAAAPLLPPAPTDTVVLRLPNKVLMTLVVQNAAQLRELKKYQLDSLTARLAGYIEKTEAAAQTGSADQVTMRFRPDQDHPGQQLPAEVRITARKPTAGQPAGSRRAEATWPKKKYGFSTDHDGMISYRFHNDDDTLKHRRDRLSGHIGLRYDFGVNTFVNGTADQPGVPSLRHRNSYFGENVAFLNFGLNYVQPLLPRGRARLALTFGPEVSVHSFALTGNEQWTYESARVSAAPAPLGRDIRSSSLTLTTLNVPVMLRFRLLDKKQDNKTLSAGIGAFGGIRLGNSLDTNYRLAGSDLKYESELKGPIGLRDWQYGVQGEIGFHVLRFFARYNLNELFEAGRGPQTHAFVAGFRLLGY